MLFAVAELLVFLMPQQKLACCVHTRLSVRACLCEQVHRLYVRALALRYKPILMTFGTTSSALLWLDRIPDSFIRFITYV